MKKGSKMLISILVILIIITGGTYYLLIPKERVTQNTNNKIITEQDLLQNASIDEFQLVKNPLRLKGKVSISSDEFQNIIYTIMNEYNVEDFKHANVDINNSKVKIMYPYKVLGFIDSQLEVNLIPDVVENKLNIVLTDAKLGKINISDKILKEGLKKYREKIPFEVKNNTIIIDKNDIYPTTLNKVEITEKDILIDLEIQANNLIDFISKYNINVKQ
ncbi:hypothetical protein [Clostridium sp. CCUG 7971]|uniref:hypothetical protein n=1 Tax=Clostridium sp. CCUG 7971 TaxID=2811414 RepID=UPI001ABB5EF4|nr:hypothetical protein [Clostridium sp. CCUG 7971]MBO3443095.1 hypothetical protein [Clostridium sp. CCUG 7971]